MEMGKKIKILRIEQDLSSKELAKKAGIAVVTLSRIANGHVGNNATISVLTQIAEALDVSIDWLIDENKDYPPPRQLVTNKQKKMKK